MNEKCDIDAGDILTGDKHRSVAHPLRLPQFIRQGLQHVVAFHFLQGYHLRYYPLLAYAVTEPVYFTGELAITEDVFVPVVIDIIKKPIGILAKQGNALGAGRNRTTEQG